MPSIRQILKITRTTTVKNKTTVEVAYGITNIAKSKVKPMKIMEIWRKHWHIENRLHWVRDNVFNEDRSTICKDNAPQNIAALRNLIIAISCKFKKSVTDIRCEYARFHKRAFNLILEN